MNYTLEKQSAGTTEKNSAPPNAIAVHVAQTIVPTYLRVPKPGQLCPWSGLSRSKMLTLVLPSPANDWKPPVKSISLRQKGRRRGCRLVVYASLISVIEQQAEGGQQP